MKILYLIPARGGSKGIPGKNIRAFNGVPLIVRSINSARELASDIDICVSTDDEEIINVVRGIGLDVPFVRPASLAGDSSGMHEVIVHALDYYISKGVVYDYIVLLQPTSPLRTSSHIKEALALISKDNDMVVSVVKSKANPYFNLFELNAAGYLEPSKTGNFVRRQDCPEVYQYNGAIYIARASVVLVQPLHSIVRKVHYLMSEEDSLDLDTEIDWKLAEMTDQMKR